ncbi:uncharacterized protein LOC132384561 [Hypanus sabinus]|uniref:uncharacterized protein LOC132384561 n=1 Tax=Hypanus sabinus TaxID=79690 RepID=UPI0028C3CC27|nr:uncharacterized protein LOC132384561 [Hypanus sabinus]
MGDFNFPNIDWHLISSNGLDGAEFVKCVQDGFLSQYVDRLTRRNAILDLVLGNKLGQVIDLSVGEHLGDSDYRSLAFNIIMKKDRIREDRKIFNWGRGNYEAIRLELVGVNWDDVFAGKCTVSMWLMFRDLLQDVRDKFVPVRKIKNGRVKGPWVTSELENLVRCLFPRAPLLNTRGHGFKQGCQLLTMSEECSYSELLYRTAVSFWRKKLHDCRPSENGETDRI